MTDPRVDKLAKLLTNYCVEVQPGDRVAILGSYSAYPLVKETYRQVLRSGGHPMVQMMEDDFQEILY
jgi:aminopeptidase